MTENWPSPHEQKDCHVKTIEQLIFFYQKLSHIILLKVTKFQQPLLITLGVADEKPEGGGKKPPLPVRDRVKIVKF